MPIRAAPKTRVAIRAVPIFLKHRAPRRPFYKRAPGNGSAPACFAIKPADMSAWPDFHARQRWLSETLPGHHLESRRCAAERAEPALAPPDDLEMWPMARLGRLCRDGWPTIWPLYPDDPLGTESAPAIPGCSGQHGS